jgi:hypothetical protein
VPKTFPLFSATCQCGSEKLHDGEPFYVHPEIELPEISMEIAHFILHQGNGATCSKMAKVSLPGADRSGYGVRLSTLITDVASIEGVSRTSIQEFCRSGLKFDISPGTIQKVIGRVCKAIQPHYQAIAEVTEPAISMTLMKHYGS